MVDAESAALQALTRAALAGLLSSARSHGEPEGCDMVTAELSADGALTVGYWRDGVQLAEVCT